MRTRTLLSMSLALMIGMTTVATPVLATGWGHDSAGKHYRLKDARGEGARHRKHENHARRNWQAERHWRKRLRRQYWRYRQNLRYDYSRYSRNYGRQYHRGGHLGPQYHRGGHYGHGYGDRNVYDDRSGLTIIYRGHPY